MAGFADAHTRHAVGGLSLPSTLTGRGDLRTRVRSGCIGARGSSLCS